MGLEGEVRGSEQFWGLGDRRDEAVQRAACLQDPRVAELLRSGRATSSMSPYPSRSSLGSCHSLKPQGAPSAL